METAITKRAFCENTVSLLGYGCMRFPEKDGQIDKEKAMALIDRAIAGGVNYFDTAYPYHGGKSEGFLKEALIGRYDRSRFFLADKMPLWDLKEPADLEKIFGIQMERLGAEYIDYYLLHALSKNLWQKAVDLGAPAFLDRLKAEGRIRRAGFSFHDSPEVLHQILDGYNWDFVQLQINYYDWRHGRADEMYKMCEERGLPVIVMEPVRGGSLARMHKDMVKIFTDKEPDKSVASWAIRFAASLPGVATVLSGMTTMEQLEDNLGTLSPLCPLGKEEYDAIDRAMDVMDALPVTGCTGCRYCKDCPKGLDIPHLLACYDNYLKFDNDYHIRQRYLKDTPPEKQGSACVACGACMKVCPQHLPIPDLLKKVHALAMSMAD